MFLRYILVASRQGPIIEVFLGGREGLLYVLCTKKQKMGE